MPNEISWKRIEVKCTSCRSRLSRRPLRPKDGKQIINFFCDNACKARWQREQKEYNKDWLYQKYIVEKLSAKEISLLVNRNPKRVWEWLKDYGIPTRPRGSNEVVHFQVGHKLRVGCTLSDAQKEQLRQCRIKDGGVPYLKNGVHHLKGKRGEETPNWKGGITPERQSFYASQEWKDACQKVWKTSDAKCQLCGLDYRSVDSNQIKFHIHHIVSFMNVDLRANPQNLVLLCRDCHLFVHSKRNVTKKFIGDQK
jgi:hypothetical protein